MRAIQQLGYSADTFNQQFNGVCPRILIGQGLEEKHGYDQAPKKSTDEIVAKQLDFYFPGLGVQKVKFPATFSLPAKVEDMAEVTLTNPTACIAKGYLYVKADGFTLK